MHDDGPELTSEFLELLTSCDVKSQPAATENPRTNLVERTHIELEEMMRTVDFSDSKNLMRHTDALLSTCVWAMRSHKCRH